MRHACMYLAPSLFEQEFGDLPSGEMYRRLLAPLLNGHLVRVVPAQEALNALHVRATVTQHRRL